MQKEISTRTDLFRAHCGGHVPEFHGSNCGAGARSSFIFTRFPDGNFSVAKWPKEYQWSALELCGAAGALLNTKRVVNFEECFQGEVYTVGDLLRYETGVMFLERFVCSSLFGLDWTISSWKWRGPRCSSAIDVPSASAQLDAPNKLKAPSQLPSSISSTRTHFHSTYR